MFQFFPLLRLAAVYSTVVTGLVPASRAAVYRALLDPAAVARWRVPDGMTGEVHELDPRVGGRIRMSLTYDDPATAGSRAAPPTPTAGRTSSWCRTSGSSSRSSSSPTTPVSTARSPMTTTLRDAAGGTEVEIRMAGLPDAVPADQNELGTRMALDKLARLVGWDT